MSDTEKPPYESPELSEFGAIEDITGGRANGLDGDSYNDGGVPPGQGGDNPGQS